jgi:CBS-domain-containing membrane protein
MGMQIAQEIAQADAHPTANAPPAARTEFTSEHSGQLIAGINETLDDEVDE